MKPRRPTAIICIGRTVWGIVERELEATEEKKKKKTKEGSQMKRRTLSFQQIEKIEGTEKLKAGEIYYGWRLKEDNHNIEGMERKIPYNMYQGMINFGLLLPEIDPGYIKDDGGEIKFYQQKDPQPDRWTLRMEGILLIIKLRYLINKVSSNS